MIGIHAPFFDLEGSIYIPWVSPGSTLLSGGRRATRYGTLEGGSVMFDGGYSASDETLRVVIDLPTREQIRTITHLGETYPQVRVSLKRGTYDGALVTWAVRNSSLEFDIDLLEKKSS